MEENRKLIIAALVVILGSNASGIINASNANARKDPFTGTDGDKLEYRVRVLEITSERHKIKLEECLKKTGLK